MQVEPGEYVQAVVSSHELATQAGLEMLAQGGTAADAAIAVAGVLSVVEPWFSNVLGGGTWALYFDAETGEVTSLDGVGPNPSNVTREDYAPRAGTAGIHNANVPGAWDGWMLWLDRYGRLDLGQILGPAIMAAREGHPVSPTMAFWLDTQADIILEMPDTAQVYAPEGVFPEQGEIFTQPQIADTLEAIASAYEDALGESRAAAVQAARDYVYRGPIAEAIVAFSDANDGYFVLDDFETFEAAIVDAISINYGDDLTVFQNPPNSQGITMLIALNILKGFDFSQFSPDDPNAVHLQVEALKLAFADRYHYVGDPERIDIPVEQLLSDEHAIQQRERIDIGAAMSWPIEGEVASAGASNTTTFHILDQYGNGAAVTTSLGGQFLVVGDTGIHINERLRFLSLEEGNANELEPGYKVRHTSNPYMVLRGNRPYILGGNTGIDTQPQGQLQQFINVVEFGMTAQEAVDRLRFVSTSFPASSYPHETLGLLQLEEGFPSSLVRALRSRGHDVTIGEGIFGVANMLVVNEDGTDAQVGAEPGVATASGEAIPAS
jgi:gamma-glutamyltranspeptidase / glutathione hydrolase